MWTIKMDALSARIRQLPEDIEIHILKFAIGKNEIADDSISKYETRIRFCNFTLFYENEPPEDESCSKCVYDCYEDRCSVCFKVRSFEWI